MINSNEPAICRAQTNPGSKAHDKHPGTQHPAGDAGVRGRARQMTGLRCTKQRPARGVRLLHAPRRPGGPPRALRAPA